MSHLLDALLTPDNLVIVLAVYTAIRTTDKYVKIPARLKPILSIILSITGVYADFYGLQSEAPPNHGNLLMLGLVLGNAASHAHNVLKGTIFAAKKDGIQ